MSFKRGDTVGLAAAAEIKAGCCLRENETGTVIQRIRDGVAWRTRRERAYLFMVRGPRGETTCFVANQLIKAQPRPTKPDEPSPPIVKREKSCCEKGGPHEALPDMRRGIAAPILSRQVSAGSDDSSEQEDAASSPVAVVDEDPWEEVCDPENAPIAPAAPPALKRTLSKLDAEIRVAYWRDPAKKAREARDCKRTGRAPRPKSVESRISGESSIQLIPIDTADILEGHLTTENYDVLCVPGGYAPNYDEALESGEEDEQGANRIRDFVASGGGYVGICAGAYLGCNYSLGLIDVDIVDIEHWARGFSQRCYLQYTSHGQQIMGSGDLDEFVVRYANGPLLAIGDKSDARALALFRSDFAAKRGCPIGVMRESPAVVALDQSAAGSGRVVLVSPHIEDGEPYTRAHFRNLFRWAARREPAELLDSKKAAKRTTQQGARGRWWRTLDRLDPKKYRPSLRDHGVTDGLSRLNKESRATARGVSKSPTRRTKVKVPARPSRSPARRRGGSVKLAPSGSARKSTRSARSLKPLKAAVDGYSLFSGGAALPYVECINGAILFTAPHGLKLCAPRRKHNRERYTSELVLKMAKLMKRHLGVEASFMVWNYKTARKSDPRNLDPNFLLKSEWKQSPWHTTLRKFRAKFKDRGVPCFHVDFHGKLDRKKIRNRGKVDVGIQPFLENPGAVGWEDTDVEALRDRAKVSIDAALRSVKVRGHSIIADEDPYLHGWWGDDDDDETTMTHQAVLEGIPSFQLENPLSFRKLLNQDDAVLERFTKALYDSYKCACEIESKKGVVPHKGVDAKSGATAAAMESTTEPDCFFVYGSLRPDDLTNKPWRRGFLRGAECQERATVNGVLFEDQYACLALDTKDKNYTVKGYVVRFPASMQASKLREADEIEDCPDLYTRVCTTAVLASGRSVRAWAYTRPDCNRSKPIKSGDWVTYCASKDKISGAVHKFISDGFPVYQGQLADKGGRAAFEGRVGEMIDRMVSDASILDRGNPDRQV